MQLEERVVNLEEQVVDMKNDNTSLRKEVQLLKQEFGKLVSSDNEWVLGELCCQIQSMIFKKVLLPSQYSEHMGYNLKYMKRYRSSERAKPKG